ncbi:MAG: PhnA domain-containing protein [Candidatus Gracilibacteria bacterium]|nr:PhnA domain-containing protein [Candidatus Gracilibacteria bacterium]
MAKKAKDMSWLNDDEDNSSIEVKDCNGNILNNGDTVIAIKDLKVSGASDIKRGDKFPKIRLTDDPELIESGKMVLRTEFFKKG